MMIPVSGASERCDSFLYDKHSMQIFDSQNCVPEFRKKALSGKMPQISIRQLKQTNSSTKTYLFIKSK